MIDLDLLIASFMLTGTRVSGFLVSAPVLGSNSVPVRIKAALAIALTLLVSPLVHSQPGAVGIATMSSAFFGEFLLGLSLGFCATLVFDAAQLAGQILGLQMGFSLASIFDPQTHVDTPVLAAFHNTLVLLIFLRLDVHLWLVRALARSFVHIPSTNLSLSASLPDFMSRCVAASFVGGIQIAAPALAATIFADVVLAFVGKVSPQLPVLFLGLSLKTLLGLTVMIAALATWPALFEPQFANAIGATEQLLKLPQ